MIDLTNEELITLIRALRIYKIRLYGNETTTPLTDLITKLDDSITKLDDSITTKPDNTNNQT